MSVHKVEMKEGEEPYKWKVTKVADVGGDEEFTKQMLELSTAGGPFKPGFGLSGAVQRWPGQPPPFHHIFPVPPSQTCTTIGAMIPRQCSVEKCAVSRDKRIYGSLTTQ